MADDHRAELAAFLKASRARLTPKDVGLLDDIEPGRRHTPGLRREEVAWTPGWNNVRTNPADLPEGRRNLMWWMFTDERNRAMMLRWEAAARTILGQFRVIVGRTPAHPYLTSIVAGLNEGSQEFRAWWQEYPVQDFRSATIAIDHPKAGTLNLDGYQLRPVENPDLLMVVQLPATDQDRRRIAQVLG